MLPTQNEEQQWPTCGVVIEKEGEIEIICPNPATQMVSMANPDNHNEIYAVVLVCDKHDHDLDEGKALIVVSDDGKERLGISYKINKEDVHDDA